jgi:hypothetical protein
MVEGGATMGDPQFIKTESGEILVVLAERDCERCWRAPGMRRPKIA